MPAVRVRAETLVLLCMALAAAAAVAAAPCPPAVLARAGSGGLGPDGPSERVLEFGLKAPGRVWAEADGLRGLDGEDRDEAPEVFLDDQYLGPLLPDVGADWRSPLALRLPAGRHQLLLRCAEPGGLGPALRWAELRVLTDPDCSGQGRARRRAAPARVARVVAFPCGPLRTRDDWPARLRGRDLVLSGAQGPEAVSGTLVRLQAGQAWRAGLRIPLGPDGWPFPLVARFARAPGRARLELVVDRTVRGRVGINALGYRPGVREPLSVAYCPGRLVVRFAQEPAMDLDGVEPGTAFELGALGLDLVLSPSPLPSAQP